MDVVATKHREQGFDVLTVRNAVMAVSVVPELGAKVVSLINLRTGREWMYRPTAELRLFRNRLGDDFLTSPMTGWDECLPTIGVCDWEGRHLPDHGEVWAVPWTVDESAWQAGAISTEVRLAVSPLRFRRTLTVADAELRVSYTLSNESAEPQRFLWAMHPLLTIHDGDRLDLTPETRAQLAQEPWLDSMQFAADSFRYAKVFANGLREGRVGVRNELTGEGLEYRWDPRINPTLGLWITRGGLQGHHHLALEPTNGQADALSTAAQTTDCGPVPPHSMLEWSVTIRLTP